MPVRHRSAWQRRRLRSRVAHNTVPVAISVATVGVGTSGQGRQFGVGGAVTDPSLRLRPRRQEAAATGGMTAVRGQASRPDPDILV